MGAGVSRLLRGLEQVVAEEHGQVAQVAHVGGRC